MDAEATRMTYPAHVLETWNPSASTRAIRVEKAELLRPMTIASGPARPHLDFAAQRSASEFKRAFGRETADIAPLRLPTVLQAPIRLSSDATGATRCLLPLTPGAAR